MSAVRSAKKRKTTADRISNLPENVTQQILECLPLHDAARTSILSSHWNHRWAAISQLVLDENFCASILKKHERNIAVQLAYLKVVNDILFSHVGPIWKFVLFIPSWFPKEADISHWIWYLRTNGLKEFTLENAHRLEMPAPTTLFSCKDLTHLTLIGCNILPLPAAFQGFPHLISLRWEPLSSLDTCQEISVLETLISKCPQLQSLCLYVGYWKSKLSICAPKLQELFVQGWLIMNLSLEETTSIKNLTLDLKWGQFRQSRHYSRGVFSILLKLEELLLKYSFSEECEPKSSKILPKELESLQTIKLVGIPLHFSFGIPLLNCLLLSCPRLRQLYIEVFEEEEAAAYDKLVIQNKVIQNDEFILPCLQKVQLFGISGLASELQLIKFLLASSPALEKMSIELSIGIGEAQEKYNFATESLRYRRSSPNAEVIVKIKKLFSGC